MVGFYIRKWRLTGQWPRDMRSLWARHCRPGPVSNREGPGASAPLQTHTGQVTLQPAGQGCPGNTLKTQGPENTKRDPRNTTPPNLRTGCKTRMTHTTTPGNMVRDSERWEGPKDVAQGLTR